MRAMPRRAWGHEKSRRREHVAAAADLGSGCANVVDIGALLDRQERPQVYRNAGVA
jgi:hypothetical protein